MSFYLYVYVYLFLSPLIPTLQLFPWQRLVFFIVVLLQKELGQKFLNK
jgi:hypothetical protein